MGNFDVAFDSDRRLVLERALDGFRTLQGRYCYEIMVQIDAFEKRKVEIPKHLQEQLDEQVRYYDIALELCCLFAKERKEKEEKMR